MEEINAKQNQENMEEGYTENNENLANTRDEYGIFNTDRPRDHRDIDIGEDVSATQSGAYTTEVDYSSNKMSESEYRQLMQSLNQKQSELCTHIIQSIDTQTDPLYIFIEGGVGVGKTQLAKAIYQSVE